MMYLSYYGLETNPFVDKFNKDKAYLSSNYNNMYFRLKYLEEIKGIGLFIGPPGMGKTYTLKCYLESLNKDLYKIIQVTTTNMSQFEILLQIATELGVDPGNYFKSLLEDRVKEAIINLKVNYRKEVILVLDNIQNIKRTALEEIQYLIESDYGVNETFVMIMIGNESFKDNILKITKFEGLRQRIVVNYQLTPLTREEVKEYIKRLLKYAGCEREIIEESGYTAIFNISGGIPRKINKIVSSSLMLGYQKKEKIISNETIMESKYEVIL